MKVSDIHIYRHTHYSENIQFCSFHIMYSICLSKIWALASTVVLLGPNLSPMKSIGIVTLGATSQQLGGESPNSNRHSQLCLSERAKIAAWPQWHIRWLRLATQVHAQIVGQHCTHATSLKSCHGQTAILVY